MNEPEWLTLGEAARYLGVAQSTIRKWTDRDRLRAFKTPGGHRRYRRQDLDAFIERPPARDAVSPPRILLVDEDDGRRGAVRAPLEADGYAVRETASADDALAALEQEAPDLVLLDVRITGIAPAEMVRRVRRHGVAMVAVVLFGGADDDVTLEQATALGVRRFTDERFEPEHLVASARQMLAT